MNDAPVEMILTADELFVAPDGAMAAVLRNVNADGREAAFELAVRGGLQPSRVGGEVNPLARVVESAVVLRSIGAASDRFVQAAAQSFGQPVPPARPWLKRVLSRGKTPPEARFSALLVSREGDAMAPTHMHLKLFCDGGELYLDIDATTRRMTFSEKDPEFRAAVMRTLLALVGA